MLCLGPIRTHAGDLPGLQARRGQSNAHGQCSLARTRDRDCSREGPLVAVPHLHSVGLLRLRGAGQGPNSVAGKRSREHAAAAYKDEDSDNEPGGIPQQWWGQAPKRARSGGLVSSALSASYSVATLPFNLAYMACAAVAAAPRAGVNWLFPPAPKQRMRSSDLLRFSGDEDKPSAIVRQISFYFSDSNLPFDTFLKGEMAKDSWGRVSLAVIASFKRMRILNATIEDIAEAAASVPFLEVSEDGEFVRRTTAVADPQVTIARTVYAHPFEIETFGTAMEEVSEVFQHVGNVTSVRLVRDFRNHQPTGAVFVEFEHADMAEQACKAVLTQPSSGAPIEVCMKKDWKVLQRSQKKEDDKKRDDDPDHERARTKKQAANDLSAPNEKHSVWVRVANLDAAANWQDVNRVFTRYGTIKFVDMHHNNRSATVRYHSSRDAQTAAADTDTPSVCGSQPEISLVQGADENRENEKFKRRTKVVPA